MIVRWHKTNGPIRIDGRDWGWYQFGVRHRYYGPQASRWRQWYLHDERIK